ncbi:Hypothetical predicted protein [Olea europaea subsp. europaea]|uniref:Uncharacterized protein n=1 Tax=Olea europaea subsp. europaea TaxID=158383 RepID=A0A8S0PQJ1_OLEEU|nr:Hypothetical predicted protein [Olea europaea subsp. europaea]
MDEVVGCGRVGVGAVDVRYAVFCAMVVANLSGGSAVDVWCIVVCIVVMRCADLRRWRCKGVVVQVTMMKDGSSGICCCKNRNGGGFEDKGVGAAMENPNPPNVDRTKMSLQGLRCVMPREEAWAIEIEVDYPNLRIIASVMYSNLQKWQDLRAKPPEGHYKGNFSVG